MTSRIISIIYILTIAVFLPTLTHAYDFSLGENAYLEIKGDITYSARFRMEDPDPLLVNITQGNKNFDKGDIVNNKFTGRLEATLDAPYTTLFARFYALRDDVYEDDDKYPAGTDIGEAKDYAFQGIHVPEFYIDLHNDSLTFRLGKQIIEWGEMIGPVQAPGVSVINMFDASKAGAAGYTFRDYKVPVMSGWLSWEATNYLSLEAVYSTDFEPRDSLPVVGTFQSFLNMMGWGGPTPLMDVQIPTGSEDRQYGAAARMVIPALKDLELGFYYAHYIDFNPFIYLDFFSTPPVRVTYEDMDMYGMSFSQAFDALGGFSLYGELTYRPNQPAQLVNVFGPVAGPEEVRKVNWGLGASWMLSDFFPFTPWSIQFSPMLDFYGGTNLDYDDPAYNFLMPDDGAWYMINLTFSSADMVDNTVLSLTVAFSGGLHEEEKGFYSIGTTLTARIGDNLGLMFGYDIKGGDPNEAITYPGWVPDRDALTLGITWYFM
ncbi:MAG: DUF1302 family protein [Desulfobacteraceae bacterium]|jgi:hypothetical protein|nr:DUF1302 family protein [Desulfobacteraceae bacterium]